MHILSSAPLKSESAKTCQRTKFIPATLLQFTITYLAQFEI
jgi:hypothetical protein